jgi:hypothetical protein
MSGSFTLIDKHGNRETLERLEVWQAQKKPGVFLAMDGNQRAKFLFLKEAAIIFADQIRSSKCDKKHSPLHIQQLLYEEYGILHDNHQLLWNRMERNPGSSSEILTTKIRHDIKIKPPRSGRPRLISRPQYLPPQILGRH